MSAERSSPVAIPSIDRTRLCWPALHRYWWPTLAAQSLLEVYALGRNYDATYLAARALARLGAVQGRAGRGAAPAECEPRFGAEPPARPSRRELHIARATEPMPR